MDKTHTKSMEEVFNRLDADGDGKITPAELGNAVRALGPDVADGEVEVMIEEMDSNGDGVVDLKEFYEFHCGGGGSGGGDEALKDAFDAYDADRNGLISAKELHMVMRKLGEKCSVEDCERMVASVDSDGDGFVNLEEFKRMMGASRTNS